MAKQRPILFDLNTAPSFDNFVIGDNREIVAQCQSVAIKPDNTFTYLWGPSGQGKSHLLQATCQRARQQDINVFFLNLEHNSLPDIGILEGLDHYDLLCIDNIDRISGLETWEEVFFGLFNQIRDAGHGLFLTAACPPSELPCKLPDLKTRLSWGLILKLKALTDLEKIDVITLKAKQMGFEINAKIGQYLLHHYSRDLPVLWELLNVLNHETLAEKRKLTIPFLKQILERKQ